jgi:lanthanide-dependent methanol dehydrogenase
MGRAVDPETAAMTSSHAPASRALAAVCLRNLRLASLLAAALFSTPPARANDQLIEMAKNPKDWVMPLGNYAGHRYSALDQINESNVGKLQVAWMFSTGVLRGHEGSPLKIGNRLYLVTPFPNNVFALDLNEPGKIAWRYEPKQDPSVPNVMCCDTVNRGLAYGDGKLYLNQADTTLVALDANSGAALWKTVNGDPKKGETGTAAPLVVKDKVIVGISGGKFGARCHLTAYDSKTGTRAWRAYTVGTDAEILFDPDKTTVLGEPAGEGSSLKSWHGEDWQHSGGCAWGWITYDPDLNLIYYGTGAPAPANAAQRPGDNRWTSSIIARDADTGVARWVYQTTPHDEWSFGATSESILVDLPVNGVTRKALVQFNQNGLAYTLDRATGELLSAEKFEAKTNWTKRVNVATDSPTYGRPILDKKFSPEASGQDVDTKDICPYDLGPKGIAPASFDSERLQFIVPANLMCMNLEPYKTRYMTELILQGFAYTGTSVARHTIPDRDNGQGNLVAWDLARNQVVWDAPQQTTVTSGILETKGGIAFFATPEGDFSAVRTSDGKQFYNFKTGSGIVGNVIAFEHKGKEFIGVFVGVNTWSGAGTGPFPDPCWIVDCWSHALSSGLGNRNPLGGNLVVFALPDDVAFPKAMKP